MRSPSLRTVAVVAAHFPPSNLASVHRARLLAQHLDEFGWKPIIVAAHPRYYEEALDWELAGLVDPALEIVHTRALPTRPLRVLGDIGLRALPWQLKALEQLRGQQRADFVHITLPPFHSALLGDLLFRRKPLPFGIDYTDPWVHSWPAAEVMLSKAWASRKLAEHLEPRAVRHASLITGVAQSYFADVLKRHPHLQQQCVTAAMPMGFSEKDFAAPSLRGRTPALFDPADGNLHLVYAGALLPKAHTVMRRLLESLVVLRTMEPALADRLRLHFIGTGKSPNDVHGHSVLPVAASFGLQGIVQEHPHRMSYFDVLTHLVNAYGILIVGSTEAHYTPSKVYQAVQSRRPVLALLHESSTAVDVLERSRAGKAIRLNETSMPDAASVATDISRFMRMGYDPAQVDWRAFDAFSARQSARRLAAAMDEAMQRFQVRQLNGTAAMTHA